MLKVKIYKRKLNADLAIGDPIETLVADYPVRSFQANFQIKTSPSFSFEIDFKEFYDFPFIPTQIFTFYLYRFGQLIHEGVISNLQADYIDRVVRVTAEDKVYLMNFYPSIPFTKFEMKNIFAIFEYLLENAATFPTPILRADGWETTENLLNPSTAISIETRNEESLLAQVLKVIEGIPNCYVEHTGEAPPPLPTTTFVPSNSYALKSYSDTPLYSLDSENITSFTTDFEQEPPIWRVYCYGAEYDTTAGTGVFAPLSLADKTIADISGYASNTGSSYVQNTSLNSVDTTRKRSVLKIFDDVETINKVNPTANQRQRASNALYRKAVRFLQDYTPVRRWNMTINQYLNNIAIGNRVRVTYKPVLEKMNQAIAKVEYFPSTNFDPTGVYYVESFNVQYTEDKATYNFTLVDSATFLVRDQEVVAFKAKRDKKLNQYSVEPTVQRHGYHEITIGPGLASNCTISGDPGRSITFTKAAGVFGDIATSPAANAAADHYWIASPTLGFGYSVTTAPTLVGNTFTICVNVNDFWDTSSVVTVRVLVSYP